MAGFLAPVLAQLITLSVGDRTEGRFVSSEVVQYGDRVEAETRPSAGLQFGWKHTELGFGYSASIVVVPIETAPRDLLVFHNAYAGAGYRTRRTSVSLVQAVGFGERNFGLETLAQPNAAPTTTTPTDTSPGATPTTPMGPTGGTGATPGGSTVMPPPGAAPGPALSQAASYRSFTTALTINHRASSTMSLTADASYSVSGGADEEARKLYPLVRGPRLALSANNALTRSDQLVSTLSAQQAFSPAAGLVAYDTDTLLTLASETLERRLARRSTAQFTAGISMTRTEQSNGLTAYSVFPAFATGVTTSFRLAHGLLSLASSVASTPVLDPLTATVDPRLSLTGSVGWADEPWTLSATATNVRSLGGGVDRGRLDSFNAALQASLRLSAAFSVDGGTRVAWQTYEGETTVPASWAGFVGVSFAAATRVWR